MKVTCNICGCENLKTSLKCKECGARLPIMPDEVIVPGTDETVKNMRERQNNKKQNYDKGMNTSNTKINNKIGLIITALILFGISPFIGIIFILLAFRGNNKQAKRIGTGILLVFVFFMIIFGAVFFNVAKEITESANFTEFIKDSSISEYLDERYDDYTYEKVYSDDRFTRYTVTIDDVSFDAIIDKVCIKNDCLMPYQDNYELTKRTNVVRDYFENLGYDFEAKISAYYYIFKDMPSDQKYYLNIKDANNDKIAEDFYGFYDIYKSDKAFENFMDIYVCNDRCKSIPFNKYIKYEKDYYLNILNTLFPTESTSTEM